jgi:Tol biopolymer transport system component
MRNAPISIIIAGLVAVAVSGCGPTADPPATNSPTSPTSPTATPTGGALGPAAPGDGGQIAVGLKNDSVASIVAMNSDGTGFHQLTDGKAFDACADIGPGGALIAFCSNRSGVFEIWLMDSAGGHQRRLTTLGGDSTFPDISPDGRRIVFCGSTTSPDDHDIWMVNVDGTGLTQLTNTPGKDDSFPVWSPDGSKVLFTSARNGTPELFLMDANGKNVRQLTTGQDAGEEPPDWSPDGQRIAYIASGSVWVMPVGGGAPTRLTPTGDGDGAPAWSLKGNEIVYRYLGTGPDGTLRIVSVQSGQSRSLPIGGKGVPLAPSWGAMPA